MMRYCRSVLLVALATLAFPVVASTFQDDLDQVDKALQTNPTKVLRQTLQSCLSQRNHAVVLRGMGMEERAQRAMQYCFDTLFLTREDVTKVSAPSQEELAAKANKEYEKALTLTPDTASGLYIYRECAACHEPEGWGRTTGSVPQIAGQHGQVIIKQLADFRAGNRDSTLMVPYATVESIGGTQALADIAAYISTLEINVENGKGPGTDLALGEKLYEEHCAQCHESSGEGSNDDLIPRIQAQHYKYLLRQFQWIRDDKRRNASKEMKDMSKTLDEREMKAVLDYTSRLLPEEVLRAPADWKNPDFNQPEGH